MQALPSPKLGQKDVKERKRNMANMMMIVDELTPLGLLNPVMSADFEAALTETGTMGLVRLIATARRNCEAALATRWA